MKQRVRQMIQETHIRTSCLPRAVNTRTSNARSAAVEQDPVIHAEGPESSADGIEIAPSDRQAEMGPRFPAGRAAPH